MFFSRGNTVKMLFFYTVKSIFLHFDGDEGDTFAMPLQSSCEWVNSKLQTINKYYTIGPEMNLH